MITGNHPKNGFKASWTRLFFIFAILDAFSKFHSTFGALHFEKSSNMAKNEEKPCLTCLQPISPWHWRYPKPGFRVLISLLILLFAFKKNISLLCYKICLALAFFFVKRISKCFEISSHDIIIIIEINCGTKKYLKQNPWKLKQPQIYWNIVVNYLLHNYIWKGKCGLWWVNIFFHNESLISRNFVFTKWK